MPDRIQVVVALPRDDALPIDVQGVGLRRTAIDLMKEAATVDENSVRYKGGTDTGYVGFGDEHGAVSMWQQNLMAARFVADGSALDGVCGPIVRQDLITRVYSITTVERDL